jgi:hypothetical protein
MRRSTILLAGALAGDSAHFVLSANSTWIDGTTPVRLRGP